MVGIVLLIARLRAMNLAKSLIISENKNFNHRALMEWIGSFWPKISPNFAFWQASLIRYWRKKACCSILLKESNYRPDRVCIGSTVKNLLKLWVCKLSFLKRHPSVQNSKISKERALLQWKKKTLLPVSIPRLMHWPNTGRRMLPNSKISMESNCRPQLRSLSWISWKSGRKLSI
jgi:hypothetical protein